MNKKVMTLLAVILLFPLQAFAEYHGMHGGDVIQVRCGEDDLAGEAAAGRNAWALRCGFINEEQNHVASLVGMYWTFNHVLGQRAPWSVDAPCDSAFQHFALCPNGCFAESERLLFQENFMRPVDASGIDGMTITTLSKNSTWHALSFSEEPVQYFTKGREKSNLLRIVTNRHKKVLVTQNHPMARDDGRMIKASSLLAGDRLLTVDGPETVSAIDEVPYDGEVWNVRPISDSTLANTNIAEGFVTGSVRYQNEWANRLSRLHRRDTAAASIKSSLR